MELLQDSESVFVVLGEVVVCVADIELILALETWLPLALSHLAFRIVLSL